MPIVRLIFVQKAVLLGHFRGSSFSEGLTIGGSFTFQNGFGLSIKTAENTKIPAKNSLKQLTNNPWTNIQGHQTASFGKYLFGGG